MGIDKIKNLLLQTDELYIQRKLEKAKDSASEALVLSQKESFRKGITQSNLQLGKILTVYSKFNGDVSLLEKALFHLQDAEQGSEVSECNLKAGILLATGRVYYNKKELEKAKQFFQKAEKYAIENKDTANLILSKCALSNCLIKQNEFAEALSKASNCLEILKENETLASNSLLAEVYSQLSKVHIKRQEYVQALKYSQPLMELSRKTNDIEKELTALNNIAIYHGTKSDYKTAMEYFIQVLDKSTSIKYRSFIAQSLINIGTIYAHLFNYEDALDRYQTVIRNYQDVLDEYRQVILLNNVGNIYYSKNQPELAKPYFEDALNLATKSNYTEMIVHSLAQLSRVATAQNKLDEAITFATKAQILIKDLGDVNGKQINLINLGNIHFIKKEYDQAIRLTSQGIVAAKRMKDDTSEIRGYQLLSKVYTELKDFEKALQYQNIYAQAQESFNILQRNRQTLDLEIKYAIREKQKEIEQLTKENEYQALLLEQNAQISNQNEKLLQANEELRQFAYISSHDLKEPLRMIGSYTQLIKKRHEEDFTAETKSFFEFVQEGVTRMNNLLDGLLKYTTIGKTEEEYEQVSLNDLVDIAVINLRVRIDETNATINRVDLPDVVSIQSLLILLFQNLISNAIKFRDPESEPVVYISCEEKPSEYIISVKDNGIGIKPEFKERIFIIFQRLHTRSKYDGTGIGLSICQKIIQRIGGRIWVESELDKGADFRFTIPKEKVNTV